MLTREKFEIYHIENPQVYQMFERFALEAAASGRKKFGGQAIIERMRWYTSIETKGDEFKMCNSYVAFYVRMFEAKHPKHKDFFRKKISIADGEFQIGWNI